MLSRRPCRVERALEIITKPFLSLPYRKLFRIKIKVWILKASALAFQTARRWFQRNQSAKAMALIFIDTFGLRTAYSKVVDRLSSGSISPILSGSNISLWQTYSSNYSLWSKAFDTTSEADLVLIDMPDLSSVKVSVAVWVDGANLEYIEKVADNLRKSVGPQFTVAFIIASGENDNRIFEAINTVCAHDKRFSHDLPSTLWNSEFVVVISDGAVPRSHALAIFVDALVESPAAVLAYSDEDFSLDESVAADPWFKPCYSPFLAQQNMLIGPMFAVRSSYFAVLADELDKVPGQDVSMLIVNHCAHAKYSQIIRVPHVLYHATKRPALSTLLQSANLLGNSASPLVSIIIPTKDRWDLLGPCLKSLWTSDWPLNLLEVIIVDNGSSDPITLHSLFLLEESGQIKVVRDKSEFNWSRLNNLAANVSSGSILIFLNNDTEVYDRDWLKKLVYFASTPCVGAVGCKLLYPDFTVQHGGVVAGIHGGVGHAHLFIGEHDGGYRNLAAVTHEVSAVTGACLAVERNKFIAVGGFNEGFKIAFNDIDFCFSLLKRGLYNIYVSDALLIHHESRSRGYDDTAEKQARNHEEKKKILALHADIIKDDPFYSPNLSLYAPYSLSFAPRRRSFWERRKQRNNAKPFKILLLSCTHAIGHGVAVVLKLHAEYLASNGYKVIVGGPASQNDYPYPGCVRVEIDNAMDAAALAAELAVDLVIAHTPPFFSVSLWLGNFPPVLSYDYGEPPPHWFPDSKQRQRVLEEKDIGLLLSWRVYAISEAILGESRTPVSGVIPLGNTHLGVWREDFGIIRTNARKKMGLESSFVVLNVCRFHAGERVYKGVDVYSKLCSVVASRDSDFPSNIVFVLCGKGSAKDVREMTDSGLRVFANVTDVELFDMYCAADVYMNFSRWEGYNLGIAQSLAMGLRTFASDIPAHKAFGIDTSDDMEVAVSWLKAASSNVASRVPILFDWTPSLDMLGEVIGDIDKSEHSPCLQFIARPV